MTVNPGNLESTLVKRCVSAFDNQSQPVVIAVVTLFALSSFGQSHAKKREESMRPSEKELLIGIIQSGIRQPQPGHRDASYQGSNHNEDSIEKAVKETDSIIPARRSQTVESR
jgi:hypothetical protein